MEKQGGGQRSRAAGTAGGIRCVDQNVSVDGPDGCKVRKVALNGCCCVIHTAASNRSPLSLRSEADTQDEHEDDEAYGIPDGARVGTDAPSSRRRGRGGRMDGGTARCSSAAEQKQAWDAKRGRGRLQGRWIRYGIDVQWTRPFADSDGSGFDWILVF
ncbi:hypothetical protein ColTof3_00845 [Colletotrichum tofieldiae]|nr:hypothetical protein ColTof3_00845 [Colletotrichum tofieldiae]